MKNIMNAAAKVHESLVIDLPIKNVVKAKPAGSFNALIREPFIHFLLLGGFLYLAGTYVKNYREDKQYTIPVTQKMIDQMQNNWVKEYGDAPAQAEVNSLIENYIQQEVLYREGMKQGLDKDDEVIRRRIAQKMQFLQQDLNVVPAPTDAQLNNYFQQHTGQYIVPAKVSFTHIYFSPDKGGAEQAYQRAAKTLASLNKKNITRAPEKGDPFSLSYDYSLVAHKDVQQVFGITLIADTVFKIPFNKWYGPFNSGYGWHLLFVTARQAPYVPALAKIKNQVEDDYSRVLQEQQNKEVFEKVKRQYNIKQEHS